MSAGLDFGAELAAEAARARLAAARRELDDALAEAQEGAGRLLRIGRSEAEVARRLGVSRQTVRRWFPEPPEPPDSALHPSHRSGS